MKDNDSTMSNPIFLIVDDTSMIRKLVWKILKKGYPNSTVYEASNGTEVEEKVLNVKPNLIILDYQMPGLDGLQVCQRIRQNPVNKHIKILMSSGSQSEGLSERALLAGANKYLEKPFSVDAFHRIITNLLNPKKLGGVEPLPFLKVIN